MQLANEVVSNASVDLEGFDAVSSKTPSLTNIAVLKSCGKKRKHSANSGVEAENSAVEVGVPHNHSLKIAALEALETLLTTVSSFNLLVIYYQNLVFNQHCVLA